MTTALPEEILRWAATHTGAQAAGADVTPMDGGAVAGRMELITIRTADGSVLRLVRKWGPANEIAGLRAAQQVRAATEGVIPHLVASGVDDTGPWLVIPFHAGAPLPQRPAPRKLFVALAHVHARFRASTVDGVPVVSPAWWRGLIEDWALPEIHTHRHRHPAEVMHRVERVLTTIVGHSAVPAILTSLPATLLHGDVHHGNILVGPDGPQLIDWGSTRIGPAMLDLANITTLDSPEMATYQRIWQRLTGAAADKRELSLGFTWAAVQIPAQYLPWTVGHRATPDVTNALDRIEEAMRQVIVAGQRIAHRAEYPGFR